MSTELHEAFAVIDLGSNSFHLLLGRVFLPANTWHIEQQFSEAVQIRAGLSPQGELTWESMNRALACLDNFADKLVEFSPALHKVRVIGTATLRMAKNSTWFLRQATKILGYPIEVISGEEEAELIYHAFAQYLPRHMHEKILGIDVGGGSIELVVGEGRAPQASVSISVGCIELQVYFLEKQGLCLDHFALAIQAVQQQIKHTEAQLKTLAKMGWQHAYAGSGSAEIIGKVMRFLGLGQENCIDYASLIKIQDYLISCQDYRNLNIFGLKDYQLLLLPGLVAIFLALMMQLELDNIKVLPVALRHGVMASWQLCSQPPCYL